MFRIICVLVIIGLHNCYGNLIQTNEQKQHFLRYRPNFSSQIENETEYLDKYSHDLRSQVTFGLKVKPITERKLNITKESNSLLKNSNQWKNNCNKNENTSRKTHGRDSLEKRFKLKPIGRNAIELKNIKHSLRRNIIAKPKSLMYLRPTNNPNAEFINSVRTGHDLKRSDNFQTHQKNQILSDCCSVISNVLYVRNSGSKSVNNGHKFYKGPGYLPPIDKTSIIYEAPEYLPPTKRPDLMNEVTKRTFSTKTAAIPSTLTTIKNPYYIPIVNRRPGSKQPVSSTRSSTTGPVYIPATKRTTFPNEYEISTEYDPSKAMVVPAEDDDTVSVILPPKNHQADNRPREEGVELKENIPNNVTTLRPDDRFNERGDVPDEEYEQDEDDFTSVHPTMAIPVEYEDHSTSRTDMLSTTQPMIASTTLKMTLITTDLSTTNKRIPMANFDNDRHLIEQSGFTTQINIKNTTLFKGNEYLPPEDSTIKVPAVISTPQPGPAPAMDKPVPPDPEDSIPPSTITATALITVDTSLKTTATNRHQTKADRPIITTLKPFSGSEYLPPSSKPVYLLPTDTTTRIPVTASSGVAPAMAMPVPPKPEDTSIPTSVSPPEISSIPTPQNTSTDFFRVAETTSMTSILSTETNFKGPEYLLPKMPPSPVLSPEIAKHVPNDPCESDPNNTPDIDPRSSETSCGKKPKLNFRGPQYLPSLVKTRV